MIIGLGLCPDRDRQINHLRAGRGFGEGRRSAAALRKLHTKVLDDGTPVHSFATLLKDLSRIVRNACRPRGAGPEVPTFEIVTTPSPAQQRAYDLLKTIAA